MSDRQEGMPVALALARRARWVAVWALAGATASEAQPPPLPVIAAPPAPFAALPVAVANDTPPLPSDVKKGPADAIKPADKPNGDKGKTDEKEKKGDKDKDDADKDEKKDEEKDEKKNGKPAAANPIATGTPMSLGECLAIAVERQPNLKAAKSSLTATELGQQSLNNVGRLAEHLSPDIPVRRKQAASGVSVASAEVQKVYNETVYDVTRLYWTFVYARQQEVTASDIVDQLNVFYGVLEEIIKAGLPPDQRGKLNNFTLYNLRDVISDVKRLRVNAITGQKQALAALKEAMGVEQSFDFHPKDTELPVMDGAVSQDEVVAAAMSRRPELAQAAAGVDAFRLEVCAQGLIRFRQTVPTLASGSDLHSRQVPMPIRNGEYRPGALAPEMPPMLVGKTESRVARATELSVRQDAVYEKTQALVRLEANNAYIHWHGATERMKEAKLKYDNARRMVEEARAANAVKQDPELVVRSEGLAGKAQAEYLEAVFEHIKALATLERVTAGAVSPAFPGR